MFIDEARIRVKAGDGGNGCMAFRREKFVPRGGPSGGDGGHGGDVLMSSSLSHNTLVHFRFNPEHKAQRGGHGLGSNCSGETGEPTTLNVPVGTLLYDDQTGELIHDFAHPGETIVIARGGRGGRGNQHFATSHPSGPARARARPRRRGAQLPPRASPARRRRTGRLPQRRQIDLDLTPLRRQAESRQLRLHYPRAQSRSRPGWRIPPHRVLHHRRSARPHRGCAPRSRARHPVPQTHRAHLGHRPPRRCLRLRPIRPDPVADFKVITAELKSFDPALAAKPTILVAAKTDVANPDKLKKLAAFAKRRKLPFYAISAVTGEGIEPLKYAIAEMVAAHRPTPIDLRRAQTGSGSQTRQAQARLPAAGPRARGRAR